MPRGRLPGAHLLLYGAHVVLLYYPDENHWVLKPENNIVWHSTILDWMDRWTGNATN